jgi:hypothetical protein
MVEVMPAVVFDRELRQRVCAVDDDEVKLCPCRVLEELVGQPGALEVQRAAQPDLCTHAHATALGGLSERVIRLRLPFVHQQWLATVHEVSMHVVSPRERRSRRTVEKVSAGDALAGESRDACDRGHDGSHILTHKRPDVTTAAFTNIPHFRPFPVEGAELLV